MFPRKISFVFIKLTFNFSCIYPNTTIFLKFNNFQAKEKAEEFIIDNYTQFNFPLTSNGENSIQLYLSEAEIDQIESDAIDQNLTTLRNRVNELGVSEPIVQRQGKKRIVVQLPGIQDTAAAYMGSFVKGERLVQQPACTKGKLWCLAGHRHQVQRRATGPEL